MINQEKMNDDTTAHVSNNSSNLNSSHPDSNIKIEVMEKENSAQELEKENQVMENENSAQKTKEENLDRDLDIDDWAVSLTPWFSPYKKDERLDSANCWNKYW